MPIEWTKIKVFHPGKVLQGARVATVLATKATGLNTLKRFEFNVRTGCKKEDFLHDLTTKAEEGIDIDLSKHFVDRITGNQVLYVN